MVIMQMDMEIRNKLEMGHSRNSKVGIAKLKR